jgi:hypothetical protein
MRIINLTNGKVALVDDDDYDNINQYRWTTKKNRNTFYAMRRIVVNGVRTTITMHREILGLPPGNGEITDHCDQDGLNNQKNNLRIVSPKINSWNIRIHSNNTSGYRGVYWNKGCSKWIALITNEDGKLKHLGCFNEKTDAAHAADNAIRLIRGKYAILNFPIDEILGKLP